MMRKIWTLVALMLLFLDPGVSDLRPTNFIQTVWPNPSPSWIQAQAFCRERNLDLVTIGSERENQLYVLNAGWMGLYRENSTAAWKWSRRGETANFTNWRTGEPKDPNNCAFKFANDPQWVSDLCGNKHSVMCSDETLVLVKENRTWEQALNHCRSLEALDSSQPATAYQNYRYDLASLLTLDDHVYAQEKAQDATTDEVWTGLRYLAGQWLWVGGELVQYPAIGSCPTHTACGVLKNGIPGFGTMDCTWKRNFICYKQR
ncbi:macrophage mannose receptor 1 [Etheostoma spectabile]|uniref:macrophage mannose receptor 1 n=1 Tax=Etheostoma spectabile TaxID=54343 RepID=UPI0013AF57C6|nr:macrophage mannose receptor 1-like [Etheostoma spectabile]